MLDYVRYGMIWYDMVWMVCIHGNRRLWNLCSISVSVLGSWLDKSQGNFPDQISLKGRRFAFGVGYFKMSPEVPGNLRGKSREIWKRKLRGCLNRQGRFSVAAGTRNAFQGRTNGHANGWNPTGQGPWFRPTGTRTRFDPVGSFQFTCLHECWRVYILPLQ